MTNLRYVIRLPGHEIGTVVARHITSKRAICFLSEEETVVYRLKGVTMFKHSTVVMFIDHSGYDACE